MTWIKVFVSSHFHKYTQGHIRNQIVGAKFPMCHDCDWWWGGRVPVSRSEVRGFNSPMTHRNFCNHNLITNVALGILMTMRVNKNLYSRRTWVRLWIKYKYSIYEIHKSLSLRLDYFDDHYFHNQFAAKWSNVRDMNKGQCQGSIAMYQWSGVGALHKSG